MDPDEVRRARRTGVEAVAALRRTLASRVADLIRSDPSAAATAVDMGLVDARWLDDPASPPALSAPPVEVLERFLQRAVDARPSRLGALGLGAVQALASLEARPPGSATVTEICVVFADLEGFTSYTDSRGDQAALELLTAQQRRVTAVVHRYRGRIVKHLGDGAMCTFTDPECAVSACAALVGGSDLPLRVRAGGNLGEAVVTRGDVIGHAVNVAARVTEAATGGQALITSSLARAAGEAPGLHYGAPRLLALKGVSEVVEVREVLGS